MNAHCRWVHTRYQTSQHATRASAGQETCFPLKHLRNITTQVSLTRNMTSAHPLILRFAESGPRKCEGEEHELGHGGGGRRAKGRPNC